MTRSTLLVLSLFLVFGLGCSSKSEDWQSIFNGRDLDGWTPKFTGNKLGENYKNTFRAENGNLVVSYDEYESFEGKFGHLFYKDKLSHYKLRLQYRFVGDQIPGAPEWAFKNSGIKFHSQEPELIPVDQELLVAVETQLLGGNGTEDRPTANVCTAGTHIEINGELITQHCTPSSSPTFHDDQWVSLEIEVRGNDKVIHKVNGEVVFEYERPQLDTDDEFAQKLIEMGRPVMLSEGYIALQAESHPVEFRNIELLKLEE